MLLTSKTRLTGFIASQFLLVSPILAQGGEPPRFGDISVLLYRLLDLMYAFGGVIFLALLIFIGFQWMSSAGNEEAIGAARQRLIYWVLGFILYFFSATIVTSIYTTLEVKDCTGQTRTPGLSIFYENACPEPTYYIEYTAAAAQPNTSARVCSYGNRDERELEKQENSMPPTINSYQQYSAFEIDATTKIPVATNSLERCCLAHRGANNCP